MNTESSGQTLQSAEPFAVWLLGLAQGRIHFLEQRAIVRIVDQRELFLESEALVVAAQMFLHHHGEPAFDRPVIRLERLAHREHRHANGLHHCELHGLRHGLAQLLRIRRVEVGPEQVVGQLQIADILLQLAKHGLGLSLLLLRSHGRLLLKLLLGLLRLLRLDRAESIENHIEVVVQRVRLVTAEAESLRCGGIGLILGSTIATAATAATTLSATLPLIRRCPELHPAQPAIPNPHLRFLSVDVGVESRLTPEAPVLRPAARRAEVPPESDPVGSHGGRSAPGRDRVHASRLRRRPNSAGTPATSAGPAGSR